MDGMKKISYSIEELLSSCDRQIENLVMDELTANLPPSSPENPVEENQNR